MRKIRVKIKPATPMKSTPKRNSPVWKSQYPMLLSEIKKKNGTISSKFAFRAPMDMRETTSCRVSTFTGVVSRVSVPLKSELGETIPVSISFPPPLLRPTCMLRTLLISVRAISIVHAVPERNTRNNCTQCGADVSRSAPCRSPRACTRATRYPRYRRYFRSRGEIDSSAFSDWPIEQVRSNKPTTDVSLVKTAVGAYRPFCRYGSHDARQEISVARN